MNTNETYALNRIRKLFETVVENPDDYDRFSQWKMKVEVYLKQSPEYMLEREKFYSSFFPMLTEQFQELPRVFHAETVSMKLRLKWIYEDISTKDSPLFLKIRREIKIIQKSDPRRSRSEESDTFGTPHLILSSHRKQKSTVEHESDDSIRPTFAGQLRTCKTQADFVQLAGDLWNEFYDVIQRRDPAEILSFIETNSAVFLPLMKKVPHNDLFIAFLDTFPYLLLFAHRAPYNPQFVECGKKLATQIKTILKDPEIDFKGKECQPLDEVIHYMFDNLYGFLARGRLVAFQDLFHVLMQLLNHSSKFDAEYTYIPILSELYYWLPGAYHKMLQPFVLREIKQCIIENPRSPLRPLLFYVKSKEGQSFNAQIVLFELLKEVYKDGQIADSERIIVRNLVEALKIDWRQYRTILREARRDLKLTNTLEPGDMDRMKLMKKLVRLALLNAELSADDKQLLKAAAKVLGITPIRLKSVIEDVKAGTTNASRIMEKDVRRLGWKGASNKLIESTNWYKWSQLKLEDYNRVYESFLKSTPYDPSSNHFILEGDVEKNFGPLSGEIRVTSFDPDEREEQQEIGVVIFSPRNQLVKWFQIANEIEYLLFDSTKTTFSLEVYLLNFTGKILMTRNMPVQNAESLKQILSKNHGRFRLFIVDEQSNSVVYWQKTASYFIEKQKIAPLLDAMSTKHFTSIKIISQIGQKKNPDEVIYYHVMVQNVLFLGNRQEEYKDMIEICEKAIKEKFPEDFKLCYYLGYLYFETGNQEKGYKWLKRSLKLQPHFKDALYLYAEHKLAEDVLDPAGLGCLKMMDLLFPRDEKLISLYENIQKKHNLWLRPLLAKNRLTQAAMLLGKQ